MTHRTTSTLIGMALNLEGAAVPEWIELVPAGPEIRGRDGRGFRLDDPEAVVARFRARGQPIVVDIEHASVLAEPGQPAPAQGWIEEMEVRDGAIWGRVRWTAAGRALMEAEAYRYVSPAIVHDRTTGEVIGLASVGLVHSPNLPLRALNRRDPDDTDDTKETPEMDKAIREALGLAADASTADAVVAINRLKEERAVALNSAQHPDPEKFVPRADHELALNKIQQFEAAEAERAKAAREAAVDAAIEAGKIAPASRDYHLATCSAVGVEKFREMMGTMPVIGGTKSAPRKDPEGGKVALNAEQRWAAAALGIPEDKYAAFAAEQEAR